MSDGDRSLRLFARTLDEARKNAAQLLLASPDQIQVEVLAARRSGLFGLGAPRLEVLARLAAPAGVQADEGLPARIEIAPQVRSAVTDVPAPHTGWRIVCRNGECLIEVSSPGVTLEAVEDQIRAWPLDEYQRDAVRSALGAAAGAPVRIGAIRPPDDVPAQSSFFLKITADGMAAWAIPCSEQAISAEELYRAIEQAGIEWGVDQAAIEAAPGQPLTQPLLVARGTEATASRDAAVEYLFSEEDERGGVHPHVREDGTVDYRELKPMFTVSAGHIVGRYLPAFDGQAARDVFGHELAPVRPGRETPAAGFAGKDVAVADNGIDLVAACAGRPARNGARIEIVAVYAITGDVDYSTGNVDFKGEVYVSGDVKPGFMVRATGNVRIDGMVDSANIEAGRDLLIGGGIHGHGESKIVCAGEMSARFIDSADVTCDHDVLVVSTIVRSMVVSHGQVTVIGRGSIVGGKVKAVAGVSCTAAGSPAGVATSLELDWLGALKPGAARDRDLARYRAARVIIHGDAFPGVTVTINGAKFPVRDQLRGVQFQATDRGIALIPTN